MRITIRTVENPGSKPMLTQVLSESHSHTCNLLLAVTETAQRLNTGPHHRETLPLTWMLVWTLAFVFIFRSFGGLHVVKGKLTPSWKIIEAVLRFWSWFYTRTPGVAFLIAMGSAGIYREMRQDHDCMDDSNTTFCISSHVVLKTA